MVSTYFSLLCTSQHFTFTHACVSRCEHTRESRSMTTRVHVCVHAGNIFDAACPDVSKLSLYIDYRAVLDWEESRLSSKRRESLISKKNKFYLSLLRSISTLAAYRTFVTYPQQYPGPLLHCTRAAERINNVNLLFKCTITIETTCAPS